MYDILRGPLILIYWITFFGVSLVLIIRFSYLYGLGRGKDPVLYDNWSWKWALRSIFRWLIPFGSQSMKDHPFVTIAYFSFHLTFFVMLVFLSSHIFSKPSWWGFSDRIANVLALVFIGSVVFIVIRRLIAPEVRIITTLSDYLLLALVTTLFLTGYYMAYHPGIELWINYEYILILHTLLGELLIILIPFTKFGHMILFFFTRAIIGVEFGARRGARTW